MTSQYVNRRTSHIQQRLTARGCKKVTKEKEANREKKIEEKTNKQSKQNNSNNNNNREKKGN